MSKFSRARAALLGVVSKAVPRCTAQARSTCAGVFPTRAAIAEMTGSSSSPGLIPWPNGRANIDRGRSFPLCCNKHRYNIRNQFRINVWRREWDSNPRYPLE